MLVASGTGCRKHSAAQAFFTSVFPKFALRNLLLGVLPSLSRAPDHIPSHPDFSGSLKNSDPTKGSGKEAVNVRNKFRLQMVAGDRAVKKSRGEAGGVSGVLGEQGAIVTRVGRTGLTAKGASLQIST